jgi:uncharacterized protein (DUF302 family)
MHDSSWRPTREEPDPLTNSTHHSTRPAHQGDQELGYSLGITTALPFDEAIARTTEALKEEGFGVLTTIDVQATLKAKLDVAFDRYVILGACNPPLAHRALEAEQQAGLLLPCNVVIQEAHEGDSSDHTRVDIADPLAMLGIIQNPALQEVAHEARTRLERVIASLHAAG